MSPNNQPWLRKFDAIIAERAEGLTVALVGADWHEMRDGRPWRRVPDYNSTLADIARAQEAWRAQDADHRGYGVGANDDALGVGFKASWCYSSDVELHVAFDTTESAARAWALLRALKEGA